MNFKVFNIGVTDVLINLDKVMAITEHSDHKSVTIICDDEVRFLIEMPLTEVKEMLGIGSKNSTFIEPRIK